MQNLVKRMTTKGNKQNALSQRQQELRLKFRVAYGKLSYNQRQKARATFCEVHEVGVGTFRNKMNGFSNLSETEVGWMEEYNPYQKTQPA